MTYDRLRVAVKRAWDSVGQEEFRELIESMLARCQAVIAANGLFTKYWVGANIKKVLVREI